MKKDRRPQGKAPAKGNGKAEEAEPGSETERFRALVDVHEEGVTGESGVPWHQRDHEQRRQRKLLDEFS